MYMLIESGPEQAARFRERATDLEKGVLPNLIFRRTALG
jgi:hypothetical protein